MNEGGGTGVDSILFELIRSALTEPTEEMAVAVRRSALSTNIKTRELGLAVRERDVGPMELYVGEAAFVTGSAAGVVAVGEVDGRPCESAQHPLVGRSHERYLERTDPSHWREV